MEASSIQKFMGITPRKLRLLADMVRKMSPNTAIDVLAITRKDAAGHLSKAINTAVSNAKQKGLDLQKIVFSKIEVNEGPKMKRFRAGTRGRARPYAKKMSHIRIVLSDEIESRVKSLESSKEKTAELKDKKGVKTKS